MNRLLVVILVFVPFFGMMAQRPDSTFWTPNGPVNSITLKDSILYIGGSFDHVDPVTGSFVRLDTSTAMPDPNLFKVNGTVHVMLSDSLGYVYVAGEFSQVGNQTVENIFRLTPAGLYDYSFVHSFDGPVYALTIYRDTLYVGGNFGIVDGETRHSAVSIDLDDGSITAWDPNVVGTVYSLCPVPHADPLFARMIVGGDFYGVGIFTPPHLAKVDIGLGLPVTFNAVPWTASPNANGPVYDIALCGAEIYIAGEFTSFGNIQRKGIAALGVTSGLLLAKNPGINGPVYCMELLDTLLYFGGEFSIVDGNFRDRLACMDTSMNAHPWAPAADGTVYTLTMIDSVTFFAGGDFIEVEGDTMMRGALIDTAGIGFVHDWNPLINRTVYASCIDMQNRLYAGGAFFGMGGASRQNLCAINTNTGQVTAWNPQVNSTVNTIHLAGDTLYVAGDFALADFVPRNRVAAFDINSNVLTNFNPGCDGLVRTFAVTDSLVYMGGNFTTLGGQPRENIGRVGKFTSQTDSWNPGCLGTVNSMLLAPNWVYVAGYFNTISGVQRVNLARLSSVDAIADWNWTCDTDDGIYRAEFYNNNLVLGGWFGTVNGQPAADFAILDTATLTVTPSTFVSDGFVRTFSAFGDDYFISGSFNLVNNQYRPRLFSFDSGDNAADVWTPLPNAMPLTMFATADRLFIGGGMTTTGGAYHPFLQVLEVQWVTSVEEQPVSAGENPLHVFPVPADDQLTVATHAPVGICTYTITDLAGKTVQTGSMDLNDGKEVISVFSLAPGAYILSVQDGDEKVYAQRIVKH